VKKSWVAVYLMSIDAMGTLFARERERERENISSR